MRNRILYPDTDGTKKATFKPSYSSKVMFWEKLKKRKTSTPTEIIEKKKISSLLGSGVSYCLAAKSNVRIAVEKKIKVQVVSKPSKNENTKSIGNADNLSMEEIDMSHGNCHQDKGGRSGY